LRVADGRHAAVTPDDAATDAATGDYALSAAAATPRLHFSPPAIFRYVAASHASFCRYAAITRRQFFYMLFRDAVMLDAAATMHDELRDAYAAAAAFRRRLRRCLFRHFRVYSASPSHTRHDIDYRHERCQRLPAAAMLRRFTHAADGWRSFIRYAFLQMLLLPADAIIDTLTLRLFIFAPLSPFAATFDAAGCHAAMLFFNETYQYRHVSLLSVTPPYVISPSHTP